MSAIGELEEIEARCIHRVPLDDSDLCRRAVLVILSEDRQDRTVDAGDIVRNRPRPKVTMQPNVVPPPEHAVHVIVVARKLLAHAARVQVARSANAGEVRVFNERQRRHHAGRPFLFRGAEHRGRHPGLSLA
jgi:hypothetical protein